MGNYIQLRAKTGVKMPHNHAIRLHLEPGRAELPAGQTLAREQLAPRGFASPSALINESRAWVSLGKPKHLCPGEAPAGVAMQGSPGVEESPPTARW